MSFLYSPLDWFKLELEFYRGDQPLELYSREYNQNSKNYPVLVQLELRAEQYDWQVKRALYKAIPDAEESTAIAVSAKIRKIQNLADQFEASYKTLNSINSFQGVISTALSKVKARLEAVQYQSLNAFDAIDCVRKLAVTSIKLAQFEREVLGVSPELMQASVEEESSKSLQEAIEDLMQIEDSLQDSEIISRFNFNG